MKHMRYELIVGLEEDTLRDVLAEWPQTGWVKSGMGLGAFGLWWICWEKEAEE